MASATTVIDGLVVWPGPIAGAPPSVRSYLDLTALLLEVLATAPRPTVDFRTHGDAWYRWKESARPHFAAYETRVQAFVADPAHDDDVGLTGDELRLYHVQIQLIGNHANARYLSELRIGPPAFGSCYSSPDESFGDALNDTRDSARECVALATRLVSSAFAANRAECERRLAWAEALIATGIEGVCEPPSPGD